MYSEKGNEVTITISQTDAIFMTLLLGIGIRSYADSPRVIEDCLRLMDRINDGNPRWLPYYPPSKEESNGA